MTVSTIECGFCDVEFDVMYTEEAEIKYCPFCIYNLIINSFNFNTTSKKN